MLEVVASAPLEYMPWAGDNQFGYIRRAKILLQSPCVQNLYRARDRLKEQQNQPKTTSDEPRVQSVGHTAAPPGGAETTSGSPALPIASEPNVAGRIKREREDDLSEGGGDPQTSDPRKKQRRLSDVKEEVVKID